MGEPARMLLATSPRSAPAGAESCRWECECGASGWYTPKDRSLAGMVRAARVKHDDMHPRVRCKDVDIVRVETREEFERRLLLGRICG